MDFELTFFEGKKVVKLLDPPQYMSLEELGSWMVETRDENPDLYSELVHVYVMLDMFLKPNNLDNYEKILSLNPPDSATLPARCLRRDLLLPLHKSGRTGLRYAAPRK